MTCNLYYYYYLLLLPHVCVTGHTVIVLSRRSLETKCYKTSILAWIWIIFGSLWVGLFTSWTLLKTKLSTAGCLTTILSLFVLQNSYFTHVQLCSHSQLIMWLAHGFWSVHLSKTAQKNVPVEITSPRHQHLSGAIYVWACTCSHTLYAALSLSLSLWDPV